VGARHPPRLAKRLAQDVFDLPVQATQIVIGPALHRFEHRRVDAQEEGFPDSHDLLMDGAGVENRLCASLTAEDDQEIADHRRLPFLVELHNALVRKHVERHFDHAHGTLHDPFARRDDRTRLLPLQHRGRDLRRIRQVTDPRFDDVHAGFLQTLLHFLLQVIRHRRRIAA